MSRLDFFISNHFKTPNFRDEKQLCHISHIHILEFGTFRQEFRVLNAVQFLPHHFQQNFCTAMSLNVSNFANKLLPVHCRVTLDSTFRYTRSNVELNSITLSVVPGPMSN